jgi:hypothetical protein
MSDQTRQLVDLIRQRLHAAVRRITLAELAFGFVLMLGIVAAFWVLSVAVEAGFWLGATPRSALFWVLTILTAGLFIYFLLLPALRLAGLLKGPTEEGVAQQIGTRYPEVSDRLVNLLHLANGRHSDAPGLLVDRAVRALSEQVQPVPFEQVEDFGRARRASRLASVPIVGLLVFLLIADPTLEPVRLGMNATATIKVQQLQDVFTLRNRFIRIDRATQQAYVTVQREDGLFEEIEVQLGLRNETHSQVISGLEAGQRVVLLPRGELNVFAEGG